MSRFVDELTHPGADAEEPPEAMTCCEDTESVGDEVSESGDFIGAPRDRETALSAAYLRLLGHTQTEAADATGIHPRTLARWEGCSWWADIRLAAADRWLRGAVGLARRALLSALAKPDGPLALKVLERVVPELAPPRQRLEVTGALAKIDFTQLTDEQLAAIAGGRHPYEVLAPKRDLPGGSAGGDREVLKLPAATDGTEE